MKNFDMLPTIGATEVNFSSFFVAAKNLALAESNYLQKATFENKGITTRLPKVLHIDYPAVQDF